MKLSPPRLAYTLGLAALIAWFVLLPLTDLLAYPGRLSVLPNLETDAAAYDAFAQELARTWQASTLPAKHPPGWMVVLAGVYTVFGHTYVGGKVVSWLALIASVALCAWLASRLYGGTAAKFAALLCASSPGLRAYVGTLQYEVLTGALFIGFLVLTVRASDPASRRQTLAWAACAGLVGAALVLTRETFVLVVPLAALWLWRQATHAGSDPAWLREAAATARRMPALLAPVLLVGVAATPAVLWSAVQSAEHQRLILISDKAREVFDAGNNPLANGTYNEPLVGIGQPAGLDYIRAHPLDTVTLAGRKLLYSFGILRDGWNVPHPAAVWIWRATTGALPLGPIDLVVGGGWLFALYLIALATLGRGGWQRWWLLPATTMAILLVHVITLASYRFTIPLLPVFYVLASGPLAALARAALPTLRTPLVAVPAALIVVMGIAAQSQTWPLDVHYQAADLDGLAAGNAIDDVSGQRVRVADADRGERPVALLPDAYLPRGRVRVTTRMRRTSLTAQDTMTVARVMLVPLDARTPCVTEVPAGHLTAERFVDVSMLCELASDGPATLAVFSLGQVDLAIASVQLSWTH